VITTADGFFSFVRSSHFSSTSANSKRRACAHAHQAIRGEKKKMKKKKEANNGAVK